MTLFICWVVFPLVLGMIAIGCGLLVERAADFRLPGALLLPIGFAVVIVAAALATMTGATARLATPFVLVLAVAGYGLSYPWRGRRLDRWALACVVGVFAVFAAPIVLSGQATFAGYITLDDTSTWLALADRFMQHGRDLSGLAPSTYSQVLRDYFGTGYPVGAFLPFGLGHVLTGEDTAWLFQPTIVFAGAVLSLVLSSLSGTVLKLRPLRALVAFVAAQSALLYGYSLWSGIKEITAAALLALVVALVPWTLRQERLRRVLPLALPIAATLVVLNVGGGVWFSALLVLAAVLLVRFGPRVFAPRLATLSVLGLALAAPSLVIASSFVHSASGGDVTTSNGIGNLFHRLSYLQIFGIWPAGDFRGRPHDMQLTSVLIVALCLAALVGLAVALRRRSWEFPLYV